MEVRKKETRLLVKYIRDYAKGLKDRHIEELFWQCAELVEAFFALKGGKATEEQKNLLNREGFIF